MVWQPAKESLSFNPMRTGYRWKFTMAKITKKVRQESIKKEEILTTFLVEAEHTLNSRLLTAPEGDDPLTPSHFYLGGLSRVPLPGAFTVVDIDGWNGRTVSLGAEIPSRVLRRHDPLSQKTRPRGIVISTYRSPCGEIRAVDVRIKI